MLHTFVLWCCKDGTQSLDAIFTSVRCEGPSLPSLALSVARRRGWSRGVRTPIFWNSGLDPHLVVGPDGLARPGSSAARKNVEVGSCTGNDDTLSHPPATPLSPLPTVHYYCSIPRGCCLCFAVTVRTVRRYSTVGPRTVHSTSSTSSINGPPPAPSRAIRAVRLSLRPRGTVGQPKALQTAAAAPCLPSCG
jgi:hypothetical protein